MFISAIKPQQTHRFGCVSAPKKSKTLQKCIVSDAEWLCHRTDLAALRFDRVFLVCDY